MVSPWRRGWKQAGAEDDEQASATREFGLIYHFAFMTGGGIADDGAAAASCRCHTGIGRAARSRDSACGGRTVFRHHPRRRTSTNEADGDLPPVLIAAEAALPRPGVCRGRCGGAGLSGCRRAAQRGPGPLRGLSRWIIAEAFAEAAMQMNMAYKRPASATAAACLRRLGC